MRFLISVSFALRLRSNILSRSLKKLIPGGQTEYNPTVILWLTNLSLQCFFFPIQINFVLSVLTFQPEIEPKISNMFKAAYKEECEPSKKRVVSSAYCVILNSKLLTDIPFISMHCEIRIDCICPTKIYK